ncbi:hypothetical protein CesoFtcFv8_005591 [Champsocephalus esox]|uniref:Sulfhydryl oxidase n=1 Tax=Champsocephalus esox TaxID=159716 RepID=A0AAN8CQ83_9TELE|nr:hypothetical protein CesoFtcFv8_005591 [Champsocephalus esox]
MYFLLSLFYSAVLQFFPGRLVLMNLLKSVNTRLQNHTGNEMSYETFREWLDNEDQSLDTALPEGERWVGCQGSVPHLRRYPCGIWTLFHVLTVQAKNTGGTDPQEVLSAMRNYVHSFFGCRDCAEHFQIMATESLSEVNTFSAAVLWLWSRHNRVNNRVAGALSEDPNFPKIQWPSPEMCPGCHSLKENGEHRWVQDQVLPFLLAHFSSSSILTDYLEDESQVLKNQREKHESRQRTLEALKHLERKTREALDSIPNPLPPQPTQQQEEEEEDEEEEEEEEEEAPQETTPLVKGCGSCRRTSWIWTPFVNQHFRVKALAPNRVKRRSLQRNEDDQEPLFALGLAAFQPVEADFEPDVGRRRKRELTGRFSVREEVEGSHGGRWISTISIGFSTVDISLCVILYFLSSMCLLAMFLFFKNRHRLRRVKVSMT